LIRCYDGLQDALRRSGRGEESERYARLVLRLKDRDADAGNESAALFSDLSRRTAALAAHALSEGRTEEAHELLDLAIRYDRQCLDLAPLAASSDTPESRAEFRRAAARAGELAQSAQRLERLEEAIEFARRQLDDARAALGAGERPDHELFVCLLNGNQTLLTSLVAVGQIDNACAAWDETLRVIAWSDPGSVNDGACHELAEIAFQLTAAGNAPEPGAALAPGLAERQAKLTVDSADGEARMDLRRGYRAAGLVLEKVGRFQEADDAFARVIDLAPIPPDGPDQQVKNERHLVFGALIGRAICLDALEREADAESAWQALYTFTGSTASAWLHMRFQSVARNGRIDRAIRLAEQLVPTNGNLAMQRYSAACVYAIASTGPGLAPERKEELARRAVELMEECKAAGGLDDPQELEHAKSDGDLAPLRDREDFQRLFGSM
jgi:tetratricopeptide (TPR) repeat protein